MARNEDEELHSRGNQELNHQGLVMDWIWVEEVGEAKGGVEGGSMFLVWIIWERLSSDQNMLVTECHRLRSQCPSPCD